MRIEGVFSKHSIPSSGNNTISLKRQLTDERFESRTNGVTVPYVAYHTPQSWHDRGEVPGHAASERCSCGTLGGVRGVSACSALSILRA